MTRTRGSVPQPQSSSLTLPCQILVSVDGCRSLTACGGCVHWTPASSRRPAPHTAPIGRGAARGTCSLAVKLPPLGNGPRGSHKEQCSLTPDCALLARRVLVGHASWPGFYRRSATGLAARRFGAAPCWLHSIYRHSATGLMARNQGQRDFDFALAFYAASFLSCTETSNPQGVSMPHADCGGAERR